LIECRPDRVVGSIAQAVATLLKRMILTAREDKLLAVLRVILHVTTERAGSHCCGTAFRKASGVELENKPPINGMPSGKKWYGCARNTCGRRIRCRMCRCRLRPIARRLDLHVFTPNKSNLPGCRFHMVVAADRVSID